MIDTREQAAEIYDHITLEQVTCVRCDETFETMAVDGDPQDVDGYGNPVCDYCHNNNVDYGNPYAP